jgi:putative SOS response-associated peptidase YedK
MCYYNGQKVTKAEHIRLKQLEKAVAKYNFLNRDLIVGFDYGNHAVLKPNAEKNDFDIVQMEWGFIPAWLKNREEVYRMRRGGHNESTGKFDPPILTLNAIGEEILQKPTYKKSAKEKRCLILSSGFFEWRHIYPISKRTGQPLKTPVKYPYYIHLPKQEYFFMAGIWNEWTDKNTSEYVESSAIVTTKANELMEQVHNIKKRMPTILNEDLAWEWMFGDLDEDRITELATTQFPYKEMYAYSISTQFLSSITPTKRMQYADLPSINLPGYIDEMPGGNPINDEPVQGSLF